MFCLCIKNNRKKNKPSCSAKGCNGEGERLHSFPSTIINGQVNLNNVNRYFHGM